MDIFSRAETPVSYPVSTPDRIIVTAPVIGWRGPVGPPPDSRGGASITSSMGSRCRRYPILDVGADYRFVTSMTMPSLKYVLGDPPSLHPEVA